MVLGFAPHLDSDMLPFMRAIENSVYARPADYELSLNLYLPETAFGSLRGVARDAAHEYFA